MPTCKNCGKSFSTWQRLQQGYLADAICAQCQAAQQAEELRDSFPCMIPQTPLTNVEKIAVETITGGLGRGALRNARIKLRDGHLHLSALDVYGTKVDIADLVPRRDQAVTLTRLGTGKQLRTALGRTVTIGLGVGVVIAIGIAAGTGELRALPFGLLFGAAFGLVLAGLFNLLPALFRVDPGLVSAELRTEDGKPLVFMLASSAEFVGEVWFGERPEGVI